MLPVLVALGIGAVVVVTFWDEIVEWLSDFVSKVEEAFRNIAHGAQVMAEKLRNNYIAIKHKLYYQENNRWTEQTTTRQVDESEVPPHIRKKVMQQQREADVTRELAPMLV